jgi:hypothetical protein
MFTLQFLIYKCPLSFLFYFVAINPSIVNVIPMTICYVLNIYFWYFLLILKIIFFSILKYKKCVFSHFLLNLHKLQKYIYQNLFILVKYFFNGKYKIYHMSVT